MLKWCDKQYFDVSGASDMKITAVDIIHITTGIKPSYTTLWCAFILPADFLRAQDNREW